MSQSDLLGGVADESKMLINPAIHDCRDCLNHGSETCAECDDKDCFRDRYPCEETPSKCRLDPNACHQQCQDGVGVSPKRTSEFVTYSVRRRS